MIFFYIFYHFLFFSELNIIKKDTATQVLSTTAQAITA